VLAGSKRLELQPIDYVGEHVLGSGHFTYVLTIYGGRLNIKAEKDKE
jgi:hypothetical protein